MLLYHLDELCKGVLLVTLILFACAGYAYRVNARREADDPKKRNFHPAAIFLAPITWPLFALGLIFLFIVRALVYGVFLILFTIALVVVRKLFIFIWLDKIAAKIGNKLLEANTILIRLMLGQSPQLT